MKSAHAAMAVVSGMAHAAKRNVNGAEAPADCPKELINDFEVCTVVVYFFC